MRKIANIMSMKPSKDGLTIKSELSTTFVQRMIKELEALDLEEDLDDTRTQATVAFLTELRETILNM